MKNDTDSSKYQTSYPFFDKLDIRNLHWSLVANKQGVDDLQKFILILHGDWELMQLLPWQFDASNVELIFKLMTV